MQGAHHADHRADDPRGAAVALALNQHILPRDRWEDHLLQEGDRVLLFQVIAGG
ncbi:sulfur carrier protein ThiS [Klebsiella pneumoniae]|uniref:sulfur carrier protein ThiS n=1 Tax=Klebsiella pneumoniae TaxID=573 RepID=UPI003F5CC116